MFSKSLVLHGSSGSGDSSSCSVRDMNFADRMRFDFFVDDGSKSSSVGATLKKWEEKEVIESIDMWNETFNNEHTDSI